MDTSFIDILGSLSQRFMNPRPTETAARACDQECLIRTIHPLFLAAFLRYLVLRREPCLPCLSRDHHAQDDERDPVPTGCPRVVNQASAYLLASTGPAWKTQLSGWCRTIFFRRPGLPRI